MLRRKLLPLALLLAVFSTASFGAVPLKVLGLDDMSCQAWLDSKDDVEVRKQYVAWARGFLTGHNYANRSQQVSEVSSGTVEQFIQRFCRENRNAGFADAILRMSDQYSGRNTPITK